MYKGNNATRQDWKRFKDKQTGVLVDENLTTEQLISLANLVLRFYKLYKVLADTNAIPKLQKRCFGFTVNQVRDDLAITHRITKMFILDTAREDIQKPKMVPELFDLLLNYIRLIEV